MSDESQAQRNANLARIRDNQRRSRARRKDYLNELESKYRSCEQVGVTASSEIQAAARRVIEENKRLRQMLKARGISDAEIDGSSVENPQFPPPASVLEEMIAIRKPCRPAGDESSMESERSSRCASGAPVKLVRQAAKFEALTPPLMQDEPQVPQMDMSYAQHISPAQNPGSWDQAEHQQQTSYGYDTNMPGPSQHFQNDLPNEYALPHDNQMSWLDTYPTPDMASASSQPDLQQFPETTSCQVAAGTIRTFKPEAGYELEQELGCRALGQECQRAGWCRVAATETSKSKLRNDGIVATVPANTNFTNAYGYPAVRSRFGEHHGGYSPPMDEEYQERIAPNNDRSLDAREALACAWRMLVAAGETDAAACIETIGSATFGAHFTTTATVPFTATGETLLVLTHGALARAWKLLVAASEEGAADEVKAVGGDVWGGDAFQDAIVDAIETA